MTGMTVDELLEPLPPIRRETAEWLRGVVRRAMPEAIERVRAGWHLIGYDIPAGRRTAYFAFIWGELEHVHLGFEYGVVMDDPGGVLLGDTRQVRWVTLTEPGGVPEPVLTRLLHEAARVARLSRAERVALALDRDDEFPGRRA